MSYTMTIEQILENKLIDYHAYTREQAEQESYKNKIAIAQNDVFNFDYPIFDLGYKQVIQTKILKHYYFRGVCSETDNKFQIFLDERINLIMPFYNQLYKSAQLELNPLINRKESEKSTRQVDNTLETDIDNKNTTVRDTDTTNKLWEQPQSGSLVNDTYMSEQTNSKAADSGTNTTKGNSNTNGKSTDDYTRELTGLSNVSESELLIKFRETILNIDEMIIKDLHDLFFMLY